MVQIVLLILGVVALIRLPRLHKLRAADYPEVDAAAFRTWRGVELRSAYWLIAATWGVLAIQVAAGIVIAVALIALHSSKETRDTALMIGTIGGIGLFLALLVVAAVYGSKAKRLKEQAQISWPKKPVSTNDREGGGSRIDGR